MDPHTATEIAYKNGYAAGKEAAAKEISKELERLFEISRWLTIEEFDEALYELRVKYAELSGK